MPIIFSFQMIVENVPAAVAKAGQVAAQRLGASFDGDDICGIFSGPSGVGTVAGHYTVNGNIVTVNITQKPLVLPQMKIENTVKEWFNS